MAQMPDEIKVKLTPQLGSGAMIVQVLLCMAAGCLGGLAVVLCHWLFSG